MGMPRPMKSYASFDNFLRDQSEPNAGILRSLRNFVKQGGKGLVETVKWGNGSWIGPSGPVAYAHCESDHVQFGFFAGSSLADPTAVLEGKGKFIRFVRLRSAAEIEPEGLLGLLRAVMRENKPVARRPSR